MKKEFEEHDARLRHYLLGELPADDQQLIEEQLLIDDDFMEQLLIVEDDLIDDYSTGKLSPQQQAAYQKLFLASPEGRQKLKISRILKQHLKDFPSEESATQPTLWERMRLALAQSFSPPVLKAAAALMVVSFGIFSWWAFFQSNASRGIDQLSKAYSEQRPLEARITGMPYAVFSGSGGMLNQSSSTKLKVAEKVFHDLMDDKRTASSLHALGKFSLTQKKFDEAINYLQEAVKLDSNDATIHTDLAVAFLERGKLAMISLQAEKAQADLDNSQRHLNRALEITPNSPDALFNRALAYHTAQSWKQAEESWQRFLKVEPNSRWSEEARRFLKIAMEAPK